MNKYLRSFLSIVIAVMMILTVACGTANNTINQTSTSPAVDEAASTNEVTSDVSMNGIKISWLTSQGKYKDAYKDMAEQLKKDEGIAVDFQVIPDDQFYTLVKTKILASEVPDILEYNVPTNNEEIQASKNCLDLSSEPWVERLTNPNLLKDYKDGKIYALPRESSSFLGACYYNKSVMKDLGIENPDPKTYQEFLDILEKIKTSGKGITPFYASNKDSWTTQIFMTLGYSIALYPNDKSTYEDILANKKKFTDVPEFKEILTLYDDLYKKGYVNKDNLSATYDMAKEALAMGKAAMLFHGEWVPSDIAAKWPDVELGAFIVPFKDKPMMGTGAFVQGLFILKEGKQVEEARKFLELWSQPKYQNIYYAANPGFPGFKDVDGGKIPAVLQEVVDKYITTGNYTYQINDQMGVVSPIFPDLWKLYIEMAAGGKTPDQVLNSWQKKYEDFMKEKEQAGF